MPFSIEIEKIIIVSAGFGQNRNQKYIGWFFGYLIFAAYVNKWYAYYMKEILLFGQKTENDNNSSNNNNKKIRYRKVINYSLYQNGVIGWLTVAQYQTNI